MRPTSATAAIGCVVLAALCGPLMACTDRVADDGKGQPGADFGTAHAQARTDGSKTIGLVLSGFDYAFNQSDDGQAECPDGLVASERDNWEAMFPTREARKRHLDRCGSMENRGPHCESVFAAPDLVTDPLPFREVQSKVAYGFDLDGDADGKETATTCAHEQFMSPDGRAGIDNQYYRLFGCDLMFQKRRVPTSYIRSAIQDYRVFWTLLMIDDVDNERNDDHVVVTRYRSKDPKVTDGENRVVPWQTLRVDEDAPAQRLLGRIVDGQLITEPADLVIDGIRHETRMWLRGASFRLKLTGNGAQGWRVGYVDVAQLWQSYATYLRSARMINGTASGPSAYEAMYRLADGYKDPRTGACTALSLARKLEFVRVFLRHPQPGS